MARVQIPTPLRAFTGKPEQEAPGRTVNEVLSALCDQYPDLRKNLFNDQGRLRSFVNVYVNDEDIRYLEKGDTPVNDEDVISIVPSIAGGPGTNIEIGGAMHRSASVDILVEDANPRDDQLQNLQACVIRLMEACGFRLNYDQPPIVGSWLKHLFFNSTNPLTPPEAYAAYQRAAANLRDAATRPRTTPENEMAKTAQDLIDAIRPFENVSIRLGNLIVKKWTEGGKENLLIDVVGQHLVDHLERAPEQLNEIGKHRPCDPKSASNEQQPTWLGRAFRFLRGSVATRNTAGQPCPITVFFSYSHRDAELRDELAKHLAAMRKAGLITEWHDRRIPAGSEWAAEIDRYLDKAQLILFCVSADFIASDYCYGVEMKKAMEKHAAGQAVVIPIIFRPVDWHAAPFAALQALPTDGKPITSWSNRDEALTEVARAIRSVVTQLA
jgi:molybdopterin converting factor small subunit